MYIMYVPLRIYHIINPQGFMISAHVRFAEQKIARAFNKHIMYAPLRIHYITKDHGDKYVLVLFSAKILLHTVGLQLWKNLRNAAI